MKLLRPLTADEAAIVEKLKNGAVHKVWTLIDSFTDGLAKDNKTARRVEIMYALTSLRRLKIVRRYDDGTIRLHAAMSDIATRPAA